MLDQDGRVGEQGSERQDAEQWRIVAAGLGVTDARVLLEMVKSLEQQLCDLYRGQEGD